MVSTLVPPLVFQRNFLDTSATFNSHEHLTWPYPPFSAFISILNFPIDNNRKNLTFLLIYIIPTSVLSICICGSSAGTIRTVPDTELKVPGLAPVLIRKINYLNNLYEFHFPTPIKKVKPQTWKFQTPNPKPRKKLSGLTNRGYIRTGPQSA